jgi:hypothetical protein
VRQSRATPSVPGYISIEFPYRCKVVLGHQFRQNCAPCRCFERISGGERSSQGDITPPMVKTARSRATPIIHDSVARTNLRRSKISPTDPAGRASRKYGREAAVWVSATQIGPAPSDTINHAAPTFCMKVPISETTCEQEIAEGRHTQGSPQTRRAPCPQLLFSGIRQPALSPFAAVSRAVAKMGALRPSAPNRQALIEPELIMDQGLYPSLLHCL